MADRAARRLGWRPHGRTGCDGQEVQFICLIEQLAVVRTGETIYYIGDISPKLLRFDRKWQKLRA